MKKKVLFFKKAKIPSIFLVLLTGVLLVLSQHGLALNSASATNTDKDISAADFEGHPVVAEEGETVTFTDESTGDFDSWEWDFGEGASPATVTGQGPHDVVYNTTGLKSVSLTVDGDDGEHTITKEDYITVLEETTRWYSFMDGSWDDYDTWTTDPSGTTLEGPLDELPGEFDQVIIIDGNNVHMESDDINITFLEVRSGTLDLGSTSGHDFTTITGEGTIALSSDNFPAGDASGFNAAGKGTVEFYGSSFSLEQEHTFNNMVVNMDNNSQVLTMLADYNLNGNLTVKRGVFRINDNIGTDILNLNINKNLIVQSNGQIRVGEGDTRDGYQIQGGDLPPLGQYHSIFHQVNIRGDFTNNGSVRFTNQDGPNYRDFTTSGAAVVTFSGTNYQTAELNGVTDFYNLIVDKGIGQNYVLEINSSNSSNFALYGPNNLGNSTGGGFPEQNPEIRKALWIRNGTLKLNGAMDIPSLTEGNERGGRGDYTVPTNGKLWIAGASVYVYTTIRTDGQRPTGSEWHKEGSGHTALTLFGNFRIDQGFFGTRHSAGFIYRSEDAATVRINGGTVDAAAFRSSGAGGGGRTYYYQSGGTVRVRGNRTYDDEVGGEISGAYPAFGIIYPEGVFSMSGGEILMIGRSRADDGNSYGNNGFYVVSEEYNVSGGTVRLLLDGGDNYFVHSTANLWNLETSRITGSGSVDVRFTHELTVMNDIVIGDHTILHPRRAGGETNYDLYVGRNFVLGNDFDSDAEYNSVFGNDGNNTVFFGDQDGAIEVTNSTENEALTFWDLTIDKNNHEAVVSLISDGRAEADFEEGPYDASPVLLRNSLLVKRGVLDYNGLSYYIGGEATVENRSAIGIIGEPGFLSIVGTEQIIVPQGTEPVFGNLVIDNISGVSLTGGADITLGNLGMRRGIFDIGSQGITVEENIVNLVSGAAADFSDNKMIRTAGKHSDRGVTRRIENDETYIYPLGIDTKTGDGNRYTPAESQFTGVNQQGYVTINNVDNELPTLNPEGDRALQYYWRVRHYEFDEEDLPIVKHTFIFNDVPSDYEPGPNFNSCRTGKVVNLERKHTLGELDWQGGQARILTLEFEDLNTQGDPPGLSPIETGEFTAGHNQSFTGNLRIYYTRDHGSSTGITAREPDWTDNETWTHSELSGFDPENPHRSDNPAADPGDYPGEGDVAVIGWVPWDDPKTDLRGMPHGVWIDDEEITVANVVFTQMTDEEGNPVPRVYRSNFQFRPTLCINWFDGQLVAGWLEGEGMLWLRRSDPDFDLVDIGDFARMDSTYIVYENWDDGRVYENIPGVVPNIIFANDGWGANNLDLTIDTDVSARGNFEILGNLNLILNDGPAGDISVGRNLIMFQTYDPPEGDPSGGGAEIAFPNSGNSRTINVNGDLIMDNEGSQIYVNSPTLEGPEHYINIHGNIYQNSGGGSPNGLQLYSNSVDHDRIILNLLGEEDKEWNYESGDVPNLYRLNVDKGISKETTFTINSDIQLSGPTGGDSDQKALLLKNGTLVLNHPAIDITLTSGGQNYVIPSTAGLVVADGNINATGTDVVLRGMLRLENESTATIDNTLMYGSTGHSRLEITDNATLNVGNQIRSSTDSEGGILMYDQSGGSVTVGTNNPDVTSRGVFEVFNPGSEFYMSGGELNIAGSQGTDPERAALYLDPNFSSVSSDAIITIGTGTSNNEVIELDVKDNIILPSLTITGDENVTARLRNNHLTVSGDFNIFGASNAFDGNSLNLTVGGDILNQGIAALGTDSLILNGNNQAIEGNLELKNFVVNALGEVTLEGTTGIEVAENFYLNSGVLNSLDNTVTALVDVYNTAVFESNNIDGGLLMAGSGNQRIYGSGVFGRLEIDNNSGVVSLQGPMELENNLILTNGNLNLGRYRLTLGYDSEIEGGAYGTNRMIITDGVFSSLGLAKRIATGSGSFTFPIGVDGKYTPVELDYTASANPGLIAVTPVNQAHMTITGGDANHGLDVLDYHWYIESEDLIDFDGRLEFYYDEGDVNGDDGIYWAGQLIEDEWSLFPNVVHEENYFFFEYVGEDDLTADYTAGDPNEIPELVPRYISISSGNWSDGSIWRHAEDNTPAPEGGPAGVFAEIEPGHNVTITENSRITYDLEIYGNLEVNESYGHNFRQVRGNGTIVMETATLPAGRFDNFFNTAGSTIVYGGDGGYRITDRYEEYQNLTVTGSGTGGTIELPDLVFAVRGDLKIIEHAVLEANNYIRLYGDSLVLGENAGFLSSDWTLFQRSGGPAQFMKGDFTGDNSFHNLYIVNAEGVYFEGNADVTNSFALVNGVLHIHENNRIYLLRQAPFHSGSDFDQSWIEGRLVRRLSSGSYADDDWDNLFPIAKNGKRRFVRLDDVSPHNADWTVEYFDRNPSLDGYDSGEFEEPLVRVSEVEYWSVDGPSGAEANVQLNWGEESGVGETEGELQGLVVANWNETAWESRGGDPQYENETTGYVTSTTKTSFSQQIFTIGTTSEDNPLPVELLAFEAAVVDNKVHLQWITASEINNDYFTIERSRDGENFEKIKDIPSKAEYGYSNSVLFYEAWDENPYTGTSYYRVKQTDFDGTYEYSDVVDVNIKSGKTAKLNLYPNPNRGERFYLSISGFEPYEMVFISIVDVFGKKVYSEVINTGDSGSKQHEVIPQNLERGIYFVICNSRTRREAVRMIVQ